MARCLDGVKLFGGDNDRGFFLGLLSDYLARTGCRCYAWALMANHYHLVVRLGERHLSFLMKPLNMRYAQYHGKTHRRRGVLFPDRFKSIAAQDQGYLEELVRYVHLNPIRAGICRSMRDLDHYAWCGHSALMGVRPREFQDTNAVLRRFGRSEVDGRQKYRDFLAEGLVDKSESGLLAAIRRSNNAVEKGREPACWVIGDPEFVQQTLDADRARRLRVSRFNREGWTLDLVAARVAGSFDVPVDSLLRRCRGGRASDAKKAFAYVAHREFAVAGARVAEFLGVSPGAVSAMMPAGERIARKQLPASLFS